MTDPIEALRQKVVGAKGIGPQQQWDRVQKTILPTVQEIQRMLFKDGGIDRLVDTLDGGGVILATTEGDRPALIFRLGRSESMS